MEEQTPLTTSSKQPLDLDSLEPGFMKDVEKDGAFFSNILGAFKETLWPWYSGLNGLTNGWWSGSTMDKITCFLFAKPWAWLLWVTIVSIAVLMILAATAFFGLYDPAVFAELTFILGIIVCVFCAGYLGLALLLWKHKYKYDRAFYHNAVEYRKDRMSEWSSALLKKKGDAPKMTNGSIRSGRPHTEVVHIETSVMSN